jgi:diguanylate cyclase
MSSGEADSRALRWVYLVVLAIPLALVLAVWTVTGANEPFQRIVFPSVLVVHGVLIAGLVTHRTPLGLAGPVAVLSPTVILVARFMVWEFQPASRPEDFGLVVGVLGWFGVMFTLAFLVFGTRRGAAVSLAGYAIVILGAGWSARWGMLADSGSVQVVALLAGGHAALIAAVWLLARNVEQLAAARTWADLLQLQATTDPLTGIANRRRLDEEMQRLVAQARRHDQPFAAILVDLDNFKAVNDTLGHDVGDEVLIATVERLQSAVRASDLLGRWGGEEFLLLAAQTDHAAACALAERCRQAIRASPVHGDTVRMTASFGVAALGPDDDVRLLLRRADLALYTAKSEGRDRVVGMPPITDTGDADLTDATGALPPDHGDARS